MSDSNLPNPPASSEMSELKEALRQAQNDTFNLKLIVAIVVFSLAIFFWREASFHGFEASQMQPQVAQANQVKELLAKQDSSIEKQLTILKGAAQRLGEYGKLHPDYAQILAKYGVVIQQQQPAAAPAAKPSAPAPAPAKK